MFRKHVILWTSAIVVAGLLGTAAVANAQRGERRRDFGPMRGFLGLDLTAEQREQIRAIMAEHREQQADRARGLNRQLEMELLADAPDASKIDALQAQILESHQTALQQRIELHKKVAEVLTPDQRAKARERLSQAPERPARGRWPRRR